MMVANRFRRTFGNKNNAFLRTAISSSSTRARRIPIAVVLRNCSVPYDEFVGVRFSSTKTNSSSKIQNEAAAAASAASAAPAAKQQQKNAPKAIRTIESDIYALKTKVESEIDALKTKMTTMTNQARMVLGQWQQYLEETWADSTGVKDISALKLRVDQASEMVDRQTRIVQELRLQVQRDTSASEQLTARHRQVLYMQRESSSSGGMTEDDIHRFAQLTADESRARQQVSLSRQELANAERSLDQAQVAYLNALRQRYHEEQVWQDKWRVLGTYWTWLLIGLNSVVFVATQIAHWRREEKRLSQLETLLLQQFPQIILPQIEEYLQQQQQQQNQSKMLQIPQATGEISTVSTASSSSQQSLPSPPEAAAEVEEKEATSHSSFRNENTTTRTTATAQGEVEKSRESNNQQQQKHPTTNQQPPSPMPIITAAAVTTVSVEKEGNDDDDEKGVKTHVDNQAHSEATVASDGYGWKQRLLPPWIHNAISPFRNQPPPELQRGESTTTEQRKYSNKNGDEDETSNVVHVDDVESMSDSRADMMIRMARSIMVLDHQGIVTEWMQQLHWPSVAVGALATLVIGSLLPSRRSDR